jgi:hypothetical protein
LEVLRLGDGRNYGIFDGQRVSREEWRAAQSEGLALNVVSVPDGEIGLECLRPAFEWLEVLRVNSSRCRDYRLVAEMPRLRELAIGGGVDYGLPAHSLPPIEGFGGPHTKFPGLLDLSSLQQLGIEWSGHEQIRIGAPLRRLAVTSSARAVQMPSLAFPELLASLEVNAAKQLDLAGVEEFVNLREVSLYRCARTTGIAHLQDLRLHSLGLEHCPTIEGYELLSSFDIENVRVVGKNPFGRQFRSEVALRSDSEWIFPPSNRYLPDSY